MNLSQIKLKIMNGEYNNIFSKLYNETENSIERYSTACDNFLRIYGEREDITLFSVPGRTEVGGNHTDHQNGCVLAGSVNLDIIAVASPNQEGIVRIKSEGYPMDVIDLKELNPVDSEIGKSAALIRGMCGIMKDEGYIVSGFDAYTTSNIPKGSGLSSSAAFEVLVGVIINKLFNGDACDKVSIAKYAQKAENRYFGKPCGLMDQIACSVGGFTGIDFIDNTNPYINNLDFSLSKAGYSLCIVNTGGNHSELTQDYADIIEANIKVSQYFGKNFLREVDESNFLDDFKEVRKSCGDRAVLCAIHFFAENIRAQDEIIALKEGNFNAFLRLINDSGNSSFKYLQNAYSKRNSDEQGISVALALTEKFLGGKGACRVHGGGFAGTIQAFIPKELLNDYKSMIEAVFGSGSCYVLNIRPVGGIAFY